MDLRRLPLIGVPLEVFDNLLDECSLFVGVVDGEIPAVPQPVGMTAQNSRTHGVKGTDPKPLGSIANKSLNPACHLASRLVGEGDSKNASGLHTSVVNESRDPVGDNPGLPTPSAG